VKIFRYFHSVLCSFYIINHRQIKLGKCVFMNEAIAKFLVYHPVRKLLLCTGVDITTHRTVC